VGRENIKTVMRGLYYELTDSPMIPSNQNIYIFDTS